MKSSKEISAEISKLQQEILTKREELRKWEAEQNDKIADLMREEVGASVLEMVEDMKQFEQNGGFLAPKRNVTT